jgi:hypothetical protein
MPGQRRLLTGPQDYFVCGQVNDGNFSGTLGVKEFMDLTLAMPRQRTTAPILAIAIIVSILMFPVLEHFLDQWMAPGPAPVAKTQKDGTSTWDQRAMWR